MKDSLIRLYTILKFLRLLKIQVECVWNTKNLDTMAYDHATKTIIIHLTKYEKKSLNKELIDDLSLSMLHELGHFFQYETGFSKFKYSDWSEVPKKELVYVAYDCAEKEINADEFMIKVGTEIGFDKPEKMAYYLQRRNEIGPQAWLDEFMDDLGFEKIPKRNRK